MSETIFKPFDFEHVGSLREHIYMLYGEGVGDRFIASHLFFQDYHQSFLDQTGDASFLDVVSSEEITRQWMGVEEEYLGIVRDQRKELSDLHRRDKDPDASRQEGE